MSTGLGITLALLLIPLAFFFGGALVKFGCYVAGVKMPGLVKASFIGLGASMVSSWVTPVVLEFVPFNDHLLAALLGSIIASVLLGGLVFKLVLNLSYAKACMVSLVHRSIGITSACIAVGAYYFFG